MGIMITATGNMSDRLSTRSIDCMDTLILTSLLVWGYLRSPAKNLFFCRVSKIGTVAMENGLYRLFIYDLQMIHACF